MQNSSNISQAVVRRLPRYYRYVSMLKSKGLTRVSSKGLAEIMGLSASQIRQDFNCYGGFGQQGYGYNVEKLLCEITNILGMDVKKKAIIIGVGNIGRALINNFNFLDSGVDLICAFDSDVSIIGKDIGGICVLSPDSIPQYVEKHSVDVGIVTVPRDVVRPVSRTMVDAGIRAIWNFSNVDLHLEGYDIPVENVHFSDSLMTLCYNIR